MEVHHHVRPCEWQTADDVPPAVIATFARGGRNLQRIRALTDGGR